ncbi:phosphatidate cytidylyltransferase [Parasediminibacterium sp. JCM 36343]|uniref:phosphatidate cytidylyltransferase n=1 Tax=Parasediminibacterium sp. JCM 36343 TaxID=3374279 RepID=UPI00397B9E55
MKKLNLLPILMAALGCMFTLSSCAVIGGIFKAGVWSGIFLVVFVIAIIIFIISKASGGGNK